MPPGGTSRSDHHATGPVAEALVDGDCVVRFIPAGTRVRTELAMPGLTRGVDVSVSPATVLAALDAAAARAGLAPSQAEAAARRALLAAADHTELTWDPPTVTPLRTLVGGMGFPLLAAAYAHGAEPIDEVPRWAAPVLQASTAAAGARRAFGRAATRPVITALARSLVRALPGPADLSRLALALIAAPAVQPDTLAAILELPGDAWPEHHLPDVRVVEDGAHVVRRWRDRRTQRILTDACTIAGGAELLAETIALATDVGDHAPLRLPNGLVEVHRTYRALVTSDARPVAPVADEPIDDDETIHLAELIDAEAPSPPRAPNDYGLHVPPRVPRASTTAATALSIPAWARSIEGRSAGAFTAVLPRTCGDLERWGRLMNNCLGSFEHAAVAGQSILVGFERDGVLTYVAELTPDRHIRQFSGCANRPVGDRDHERLVDLLAAHLLVRIAG